MRNEIPTTDEVRYALAQTVRMANACLRAMRKPALISTVSLIVIWCAVRVMEALNGNGVLDMTATYWFGLAVWFLMGLWLTGSALASASGLKTMPNKKAAGVAWGLFLALAVLILLGVDGFRVAASGLLAVLAGSPETAAQNTFLMLKYHPANPILPMTLAVLKLTGNPWDIQAMAPYVWSWNALFAFFIWSFACGIVLLTRKGRPGSKIVHLTLASAGLGALIFLKSALTPTSGVLIIFQAAVPILLLFQILLCYAAIRNTATDDRKKAPSPDTFNHLPAVADKPRDAGARRSGLPPSALKLAVFVLLVLPILADLQTSFTLAASSARILDEISVSQVDTPSKWITIAPISVRSGPAAGDDILGVLPKGTWVQVQGNRFNWVKIGNNRWVQEKFLRPAKPKSVAASVPSGQG